jgi:hypothetical protein
MNGGFSSAIVMRKNLLLRLCETRRENIKI